MKVAVIGQFRLPAEAMAEARPLMRKVVETTRAEDGCIEYNYGEDVLDPGLIRVSELWESREQLGAHMKAPHMAVWNEERNALGMSGRSVSVFDVTGGEAI